MINNKDHDLIKKFNRGDRACYTSVSLVYSALVRIFRFKFDDFDVVSRMICVCMYHSYIVCVLG